MRRTLQILAVALALAVQPDLAAADPDPLNEPAIERPKTPADAATDPPVGADNDDSAARSGAADPLGVNKMSMPCPTPGPCGRCDCPKN